MLFSVRLFLDGSGILEKLAPYQWTEVKYTQYPEVVMKNNLKEFRTFILRGNVVDLAVAVVIGAAFNAIVQAMVKDVVTPLIGAIYKQQSFGTAFFRLHGSKIMYGDVVNSIISFIIVAIVVFFLIVQPINKFIALANRNKKSDDPTTKKCPECLSEIPKAATRCKFCTTKLKAEPAKTTK